MDENGRIRHYSVSVYEMSMEEEERWYNTTGSQTELVITSLQPNHIYLVRVAAVTIGLGSFSEIKVHTLGMCI